VKQRPVNFELGFVTSRLHAKFTAGCPKIALCFHPHLSHVQ